jgi:hypothetical protein
VITVANTPVESNLTSWLAEKRLEPAEKTLRGAGVEEVADLLLLSKEELLALGLSLVTVNRLKAALEESNAGSPYRRRIPYDLL